MTKIALLIATLAALAGCGSSDTSAAGGAGGQTTTSDGGTTTTGLGGTGGTTETTTSAGGAACVIPGPVKCGPIDPTAYPDDAKSYDPAATVATYLNPYPGTAEVGQGAAMTRLGPWPTDRALKSVSVIVGLPISDPVPLAIWTEALCGLPSEDPNAHAVMVPLAELVQEPIGAGAVKLTWSPAPSFIVPAGAPLFIARVLPKASDSVAIFKPLSKSASRSLWWGIVDNDCDGVTDPDLGAAYLDTPTDPNVAPYHYDPGFEVTFKASPPPAN